MPNITEEELRADDDAILRRVEAGETFIVTRDGRAIAEIRPVHVGRQRIVSRERLRTLVQGMGPIDRHRFRADLDAIADPWFEA